MNQVRATARKALRRDALGGFLRSLGGALALAGGAAAVAVGVDRFFFLEQSPWLLVGVPVGAGMVYALIRTAMTPRSLLAAAAAVDQSLTLHDQLGSAIALEQQANQDPFAALAVADAEHAAKDLPIKQATPIALGANWWVWPITLSVALAGAMFLPAYDRAHRRQNEIKKVEQAALRHDAVDDLAGAVRHDAADEIPIADLATPAEMQTLKDIQAQLTKGDIDPDDARAQSASVFNNAASRSDREALQQEQRLQNLQDKLSNLNAVDDSQSDRETSDLSRSLSAGDYARAEKLLKENQRLLDAMTEQEREQLAADLDRLADAIDEPADESPNTAPSTTEQRLKNLGLSDEAIDELNEQTDTESIRQELEDVGVDPLIAQELADQLADDHQSQRADEQAENDAQKLKQSLKDAAEEIRQPTPESESEPPSAGNDALAPPEPAQPRDREQPQTTTEAPEKTSEPGTDQPNADDTQSPEKSTQKNQDDQGEASDQSPESMPSEPSNDQEPSPPASSDSPDDQAPSSSTPSEQGTNDTASKDRSPLPTNAPGATDGDKPSDATQPKAPNKKGLERARDLLKKFQQRKDRAHDQRGRAKEMRKRAKELYDSMSPAQRKELETWAKELARERATDPNPSPNQYKTEPLDLRPDESASERVIAQWFDPDAPPDQNGVVSHRVADEKLRQAAQGAQRAVEEQAVHRRYNDIIKRYFDAANRRASDAKTPPKKPTTRKKESAPTSKN